MLTRRPKLGDEGQESFPALQRKAQYISKQEALLKQLFRCNSVSNTFKGKKWWKFKVLTPILQVALWDKLGRSRGRHLHRAQRERNEEATPQLRRNGETMGYRLLSMHTDQCSRTLLFDVLGTPSPLYISKTRGWGTKPTWINFNQRGKWLTRKRCGESMAKMWIEFESLGGKSPFL